MNIYFNNKEIYDNVVLKSIYNSENNESLLKLIEKKKNKKLFIYHPE